MGGKVKHYKNDPDLNAEINAIVSSELAALRDENGRLRENLTAMVKRHRESHQNWTQAAVSAQRSGNYSLSVDIQNTALVALSGFPIEEAKEALK